MYRTSLVVVAMSFALAVPNLLQAQQPDTLGRIHRFDPSMDELIAPGTDIEVVASGFTWSEGPVWIGSATDGHLLFSDIPRNTVYRWKKGEGISIFLNPSGYTGATYYGLEPGSNGLILESAHQRFDYHGGIEFFI